MLARAQPPAMRRVLILARRRVGTVAVKPGSASWAVLQCLSDFGTGASRHEVRAALQRQYGMSGGQCENCVKALQQNGAILPGREVWRLSPAFLQAQATTRRVTRRVS